MNTASKAYRNFDAGCSPYSIKAIPPLHLLAKDSLYISTILAYPRISSIKLGLCDPTDANSLTH